MGLRAVLVGTHASRDDVNEFGQGKGGGWGLGVESVCQVLLEGSGSSDGIGWLYVEAKLSGSFE